MKVYAGLLLSLVLVLVCGVRGLAQAVLIPGESPLEKNVTQGALRVKTADGGAVECPLKHTDVKAEISGFIAQATVTQTFSNPYNEKIEAVYVFPLPHTAAISEMTMVIGARRIVGVIQRRADARQAYEAALARGQAAGLLEQERPNIFTQSVGNIAAHAEVRIEISYFDVLKYDDGVYEFHFPMVVAPRYIPGEAKSATPPVPAELQNKVGAMPAPPAPANASPATGAGWAPDTDRVPDASRITPPVLKPGYRTGHDISLSLALDAGVPIQNLRVVNHMAEVKRQGEAKATVTLSPDDAIPNKDFVLRYYLKGDKPQLALLTHAKSSGDGYFLLMMQPGEEAQNSKEQPREIVFTIDVSGSMLGRPQEKVKQVMRDFLPLLKPDDTIQVVTFANNPEKLFDKAVPATPENIAKAFEFTKSRQSGGGTEMLKGLKAAMDDPLDPQRVRMCVLFTDGDVGNEQANIQAVKARCSDHLRVSVVGIGSSPNRYLLDGIANAGQGICGVVELTTDPAEMVGRLADRLHRAQLADIHIDWGGLQVSDCYPRHIPDLWAGKPVMLCGRFFEGGAATVKLSGVVDGTAVSYPLSVSFPSGSTPTHAALAKMWARQKIDDLSAQMYGGEVPEVTEAITKVALKYSLMSAYTSFVAIDEKDLGQLTEAKPPRRMVAPVPMPEGMSYAGVFGGAAAGPAVMDTAGIVDLNQLTITQKKQAANAQFGVGMRYAEAGTILSASASPTVTFAPAATYATRTGIVSGYNNTYNNNNSAHLSPQTVLGIVTAPGPASARSYHGADGFPGAPGPQGAPGTPTTTFLEANLDADYIDGLQVNALPPALAGFNQSRLAEAKQAWEDAQALQKQGKTEAALLYAQLAYCLEQAYLTFNYNNDGGLCNSIEGELTQLSDALAAGRAKALPATKLELVIRDQSLQQALEQVAKAANVKLTILPGSLEDAAVLANVPVVRIMYLDLRHATLAQALDWLLQPEHLQWSVDQGKITVASARRLPGDSPWVYQVGELLLPTDAEKKDKDGTQVVKSVMIDFLTGLRLVTGRSEEDGLKAGSVVLLDAGDILVYGGPEVHAKIAAALAALRDKAADLAKATSLAPGSKALTSVQALRQATAGRWAAGAERRGQERDKAECRRVLDIFISSAWPLLAGAGQDENEELLLQLASAWRSPQYATVCTETTWPIMRAAWAVTQTARAADHTALRERALSAARQCLAANIAALQKQPADAAAYAGVLYAVLALRNAAALHVQLSAAESTELSQAEKLLLPGAKEDQLARYRTLAAALLAPTPATDTALKEAILAHQFIGDDQVVLAHYAAGNRGGALQQLFREEVPELTGNQPLDGSVVVLLNR